MPDDFDDSPVFSLARFLAAPVIRLALGASRLRRSARRSTASGRLRFLELRVGEVELSTKCLDLAHQIVALRECGLGLLANRVDVVVAPPKLFPERPLLPFGLTQLRLQPPRP